MYNDNKDFLFNLFYSMDLEGCGSWKETDVTVQFLYKLERSGPRTEPWGIPVLTSDFNVGCKI